jgi:hypothetical protein
MHSLDEVDITAYIKYTSHKIPAWYTKFPTKNIVAARLFDAVATKAAAEAPGPPFSPRAEEPSQKRGMALSDDESAAPK